MRNCGKDGRFVTIHGKSRTATYHCWQNMWQRCTNHKHKFFADYGGRGIAVCKRWLRFENFFADMGEQPKGTTLDRKNNNLGYSKRNCRWASRITQLNNRRSNLRADGLTVAQIARTFDIPYETVRWRFRQGMRGQALLGYERKVRLRHFTTS